MFAFYLFRIRNWAKGASARQFGKDDTPLFKGVNIENIGQFPYVEQLRIAHHFVDSYNSQYERQIDGQQMSFPFQIDEIIINGRRFFEMAAHYQAKVSLITEGMYELIGQDRLDGFAAQIVKTIDNYKGRKRTGDRYVRAIFDCLLIYHIDKFGHAELSRAIEKIFIWSYSLRLKMQVVQLATMDNYVIEHPNLFKLIKEATRPSDFVTCNLPVVSENLSTKTDEIVTLFKDMRYYE